MDMLPQNPVHCPYVLTVHRFLTELGAKVTRAEVRSLIRALPKHPLVSVKDVIQVLETWQVPALAFKAKMSIFPKLSLPVMAFFRNAFEGYMVVVTGVDTETITFYSPIEGETVNSHADFESRWSGVIVAANLDEMTGPLPTADVLDEELEQGRQYRLHSVKLIEDFFTPEECRYIISYSEQNEMFFRSQVDYGNGHGGVVPSRTSYSAGLQDRTHPVLVGVYEKVTQFLGVPADYIENLQCVRYGEGEEFKPHFDSGPTNHRIHTLLVYLNDNFTFGETYFPELDLKVKPKAGMALYFLNRNADGHNILQSAHAGLPVKQGMKYGCNIWVRDRAFEGAVAAVPAEAAEAVH